METFTTEPVVDRDSFDRFYEHFKEMALRFFEKDRTLAHAVVVIRPDGTLEVIDFDSLMEKTEELVGGAEEAKSAVYKGISAGILDLGLVGFVEIFEAWGIKGPPGDGPGSIEETKKKFGGLIENIPTREEGVVLTGRFRDWFRMTTWLIRRRGDESWLVEQGDLKKVDLAKEDSGRQGWVHKAIVEVSQRQE